MFERILNTPAQSSNHCLGKLKNLIRLILLQCKFYHFKIQTLGIWFKDTAKAFGDFLKKPKKCMK